MTFHIVTIFPNIFESYFNEGIIRRAKMKGIIDINIYDLRNYTVDKHKTVDDTPYGGGPGMVLKIEPIYKCVQEIKNLIPKEQQDLTKTILFSATGKKFIQSKAQNYSKFKHMVLICGRYEGVDERVAKYIADEEISIGNYVLTGGELPAMIVVDSVSRLIPDALGNPESLESETFNLPVDSEEGKVSYDFPVYTKPEKFQDWQVPEVLLGGNHKEIERWRNLHRKSKIKSQNSKIQLKSQK